MHFSHNDTAVVGLPVFGRSVTIHGRHKADTDTVTNITSKIQECKNTFTATELQIGVQC